MRDKEIHTDKQADKEIHTDKERETDGQKKEEKNQNKLTKIGVRDYLAKQYPLFNYFHLKERI